MTNGFAQTFLNSLFHLSSMKLIQVFKDGTKISEVEYRPDIEQYFKEHEAEAEMQKIVVTIIDKDKNIDANCFVGEILSIGKVKEQHGSNVRWIRVKVKKSNHQTARINAEVMVRLTTEKFDRFTKQFHGLSGKKFIFIDASAVSGEKFIQHFADLKLYEDDCDSPTAIHEDDE